MKEPYVIRGREVIRVLKRLGFKPELKGTTAIWFADDAGRRTSVPTDVEYLLPAWFDFLLRDIGLTVEEFHRLRKAA